MRALLNDDVFHGSESAGKVIKQVSQKKSNKKRRERRKEIPRNTFFIIFLDVQQHESR
jgi:hypothetical protein